MNHHHYQLTLIFSLVFNFQWLFITKGNQNRKENKRKLIILDNASYKNTNNVLSNGRYFSFNCNDKKVKFQVPRSVIKI